MRQEQQAECAHIVSDSLRGNLVCFPIALPLKYTYTATTYSLVSTGNNLNDKDIVSRVLRGRRFMIRQFMIPQLQFRAN